VSPFFVTLWRRDCQSAAAADHEELLPVRAARHRQIHARACRVPGRRLLRSAGFGVYAELLAHPERLEALASPHSPRRVVIDEVQRLPALLDEVHRLIERRRWRFALTGSSARKLRRGGVLAGRARTLAMHPLTAAELGDRFDLARSIRYGQLPGAYTETDPRQYLASCVRGAWGWVG
jgi:hypothetical protein